MKFRYLDGLRGLAALIVVLDHFAISFFPAATDGTVKVSHGAAEQAVRITPLHLLVSGNFSVCIFFVLSGIVLSAKFFRTGDRDVVLASAAKRYLRLMIPVLASVLLVDIVLRLHGFANSSAASQTGSDWLARLWPIDASLPAALYHGTIGVFVDGVSSYNTVLWTMQTELIGSFLVFGILLGFGRWRHRSLAYAALGLLLSQTYFITFVAGVVLCDLYMNRSAVWHLMERGWWAPLAAFSLYLGSSPVGTLAGTPFRHLESVLPDVTVATHIVGAIGLVAAVMGSRVLQRVLALRPLRYLGRVSFSLYLTHLLILGTVSSYLFTIVAPRLGYRNGFVLVAIISGGLIWGIAHVFTRFIDEPAMRLSAFSYRRYIRPMVARLGRRDHSIPRNGGFSFTKQHNGRIL